MYSRIRPNFGKFYDSCLIRYSLLKVLNILRQITPEMLQNVRDAGYHRFAICQQTNGGHFEHFLH
jgi:hypothetical protein